MDFSDSLRPRLKLDWTVGPTTSPDSNPEKLVSATVPGAVQLDWARAHGWPSHTFGEEPLRYKGLEDRWWIYRCTLPAFPPGGEPWLILNGIDHSAIVRLDGVVLGTFTGMQTVHSIPLDRSKAGRTLEVCIAPAPKEPGAEGRGMARRTTKPAVSYGWDFHPVLIPLGLFRDAYIEMRPDSHLSGARWKYRLSDDLLRADFSISVQAGKGELVAELLEPSGTVVWSDTQSSSGAGVLFSGRLDKPRLWWPAGHGGQELYGVRVTLQDDSGKILDSYQTRTGFRRCRLEMAPSQWDEPAEFPKSRSRPPMTLVMNGRRIFAKGANVPPFDIFPGAVTAARAEELAGIAADANMNLLRVWGGGPVPDEAFFHACDERGLMVLQEFPLACNEYPDDPAYLDELSAEATAILERLGPHPSVVIWSGGNELFNAWSGMTDQSHAVRLLNALTWQHDPDAPFLPTLPVEGLGHGYYLFRDPSSGLECYQMAARSRCTGLTEFGVPGPADIQTIRSVIPKDEEWPPREDGAWRMHAGSHAWDVEPTSYLCLSTLEHYWGKVDDLGQVVRLGQWLQIFGLQNMFEEARRQRPYCGWALCWCLNEPWPNVANSSLLSYPAKPKPGLQAVREALRPTIASARLPKFQWRESEEFTAELFFLHDAPVPRPETRIEAWLSSGDWRQRLLVWECPSGPADADLAGPTIRCELPESLGSELILELITPNDAWNNRYRMATARAAARHQGPRGLNV